jgi:hypothetical protein
MMSAANANLQATKSGLDLNGIRLEREELETRRRMADLWRDPRAAAQVLESCDRLDRVNERIAWLQREQEEVSAVLARSEKREEWSRLADRVRRHAGAVEQARMELLLLGSAGLRDALVEIRPIGRARPARDLLYETYVAWASERKYRVVMVREPMSDDEPVAFALVGPYAFGYLGGEAGHHRVRRAEEAQVVRVSVAAVDGIATGATLTLQKALKQLGQYGGKVRSRIEVAASGFVAQNERTLAENRELVEEFAGAWSKVSISDKVVRRYDLEPFLVRDFLTETTTGRADALRPDALHELLCKRIEISRVGLP